jgi:cell wall assembly regulator SMI1
MNELDDRAPRTRAAIRPATSNPAAAIEAGLGLVVTGEVRAWFELHDGSGWSFDGGLFLPDNFILGVDDAIRITSQLREVSAGDPAPGESMVTSGDPQIAGNIAGTWLPGYLAIGDDTCGGNVFVDLREGPRQGCVRYHTDEQGDEFEEIATSLARLLEQIVLSLRTGAPCQPGDSVPIAQGGVLEWVPADQA